MEEVTDIEELIQFEKNQTSLEDINQGGNLEESFLKKIKQ